MEMKYKNLDFGDLFVTSFKSLFSNVNGYLAAFILTGLPTLAFLVSIQFFIDPAILSGFMKVMRDPVALQKFMDANMPLMVSGFMKASLVTGVVGLIFSPAAMASNLKLFESYYQNEAFGFIDVLKYGFKNWGKVLLTSLLIALIDIGVMVLLALLGLSAIFVPTLSVLIGLVVALTAICVVVFLIVKLMFAIPITVLRKKGVIDGIGNSFSLTKRRFWVSLGYLLGGAILVLIVLGIPSWLLSLIPILGYFLSQLISPIQKIVVNNFVAGYFIRVWEEEYLDLDEPSITEDANGNNTIQL